MRAAIALCVLVGSAALADEPNKDDALKAEMKKFEGVWEGYAVEGKGEKPNSGPVHLRLTITGNKITAVDLGNNNKDMGNGTYKLDPTKATKEIDATGIVLPGKRERNFVGIYSLDGDTLKWCVNNRQPERPTEFRTVGGKYLLILKRTK